MIIGSLEIKVRENEIQIFNPFSKLNNIIFRNHKGKFINNGWCFHNNQSIWGMIEKLFGITPSMQEEIKIEFDLSDLKDGEQVLLMGYIIVSRRHHKKYPILYCDLIDGSFKSQGGLQYNPRVRADHGTIVQVAVCKGILDKIEDLVKFTVSDKFPKNYSITIERQGCQTIKQIWIWFGEYKLGKKKLRNFNDYTNYIFLVLNNNLEICGGYSSLFNAYVVLTVEKL